MINDASLRTHRFKEDTLYPLSLVNLLIIGRLDGTGIAWRMRGEKCTDRELFGLHEGILLSTIAKSILYSTIVKVDNVIYRSQIDAYSTS